MNTALSMHSRHSDPQKRSIFPSVWGRRGFATTCLMPRFSNSRVKALLPRQVTWVRLAQLTFTKFGVMPIFRRPHNPRSSQRRRRGGGACSAPFAVASLRLTPLRTPHPRSVGLLLPPRACGTLVLAIEMLIQ